MAGNTFNFRETYKFVEICTKIDMVPLLLGHTGIGKTELYDLLAATQNKDLIVIHVAQLEPSDFIGLYKEKNGRTYNAPPVWMPLKGSQVHEFNKEKDDRTLVDFLQDVTINPNGGYVLLDEINRGHEDIRQALYQLIDKKKIHTYALPDNYNLGATANPNGYEVYEFDKALVNRFAWVKVKPLATETIEHLERKYSNNLVTNWLKSDKGMLEYGDDFEVKDLCYSPRISEKHIRLYQELTHLEAEFNNKEFKRKCLETIMPKEKAQSFISFLVECESINYKDILLGNQASQLDKLIKDKRLDVLGNIVYDLADFFSEWETGKEVKEFKISKEKEVIQNVTDFFLKIPQDTCMLFFDSMKKHSFPKKTGIVYQPVFYKALKEKLQDLKPILEKISSEVPKTD